MSSGNFPLIHCTIHNNLYHLLFIANIEPILEAAKEHLAFCTIFLILPVKPSKLQHSLLQYTTIKKGSDSSQTVHYIQYFNTLFEKDTNRLEAPLYCRPTYVLTYLKPEMALRNAVSLFLRR